MVMNIIPKLFIRVNSIFVMASNFLAIGLSFIGTPLGALPFYFSKGLFK
jgi:hypothetical protein